uniref:Uncharacterized protein n=2 Tax=Haplochromini TaxID=319058 RepID=A0A3Q2WZU6_HAPBU
LASLCYRFHFLDLVLEISTTGLDTSNHERTFCRMLMCSLMLNLHYVFLLRINDHFLLYKGATIKLQSGLKYLKTSFSIVN